MDNDSDEDIVGEAVYDEEYLKKRKQRKLSSGSEEEYHMEEETVEEDYEEEEEEEEDEDSLGISEEDSPKMKKLRGQAKLRSVKGIQTGTRRSRRATQNPAVNYRKYVFSDSDIEPDKAPLSSESESYSNGSENNNDDDLESKHEQISQEVPEKEGRRRGFLDLNKVAPNTAVKDEGMHDDDL